MEKQLERAIFGSRWLQVPLYVGLMIALVALAIKFFQELIHLFVELVYNDESHLILTVLTLVDLVLVANLIVMVIIGGYENFVSKIDVEEATDKLSWFGKLDAGSIKIKLAVSIVSISAIHLLKSFLNIHQTSMEKLIMLTVIHVTFVVSALALAWLDRLTGFKPEGKHH